MSLSQPGAGDQGPGARGGASPVPRASVRQSVDGTFIMVPGRPVSGCPPNRIQPLSRSGRKDGPWRTQAHLRTLWLLIPSPAVFRPRFSLRDVSFPDGSPSVGPPERRWDRGVVGLGERPCPALSPALSPGGDGTAPPA